MPVQQDTQTVTASGQSLETLPEGMVLRDLVTHPDERGTVCELFDLRWEIDDNPMVFAYMCTIRPGFAKGWGIHREHDDRYAFISGELELAFYDERGDSETAGQVSRLYVTENHRRLVTIPAGVWHAARNIGTDDVVFVNFPTNPYDHANPEKYRLPLDTHELPVEFTRDWRGW